MVGSCCLPGVSPWLAAHQAQQLWNYYKQHIDNCKVNFTYFTPTRRVIFARNYCRLRKFSILLLKSFIGPFIATTIIAMVVLYMQFLWLYMDDLVGKDVAPWVLIKLLIFLAPKILTQALPLAILMSSIMTLGSLAENYELASMKSAGMSLFRILRPLSITMLLMTGVAFYISNNVAPWTSLKSISLLKGVREKSPAKLFDDGEFYKEIDGIRIRVMSKNDETNELKDILIYDHQNRKGSGSIIRAKDGKLELREKENVMMLTLNDGYSYDAQREPAKQRRKVYPHVRSRFEKLELRIDMTALQFQAWDESLWQNTSEFMTLGQLGQMKDSLSLELTKIENGITEYVHGQVALIRDTLETRPNSEVGNSSRNRNSEGESALEAERSVIAEESSAAQASTSNNSTAEKSAGKSQDKSYFFNQLSPTLKNRAVINAKSITQNQRNFVRSKLEEYEKRSFTYTKMAIEEHRKVNVAFSIFVLFLIGAPLGAIIRKGGIGLPTVIAILFFLLYFALSIAGIKMAKSETVSPFLGVWMNSYILLPIGLFLVYKAANDSSIMNKDWYVKVISKILPRKSSEAKT